MQKWVHPTESHWSKAKFEELSTPDLLILQLWSYVSGFTVLSTCNRAWNRGRLKPELRVSFSADMGFSGVCGYDNHDYFHCLRQSWAHAFVNIAHTTTESTGS